MSEQRSPPVYLNLLRIRFPAGAVTSIAHRITGVLLFLATPFSIYLLDLSLRGADGFALARDWLGNTWIQLLSIIIAWSLAHHLFSGIRFLLIDLELGVTRNTARLSAWIVNAAGLAVAGLYAAWLLL